MTMLPEWAGKFVSTPYEEMDCWQLCRAVYKQQYAIEIGDLREQRKFVQEGQWLEVKKSGIYLEGDILLFWARSELDKHVAIYLNGDYMLHSAREVGAVVIEKWTRPSWKDQMRSVYRHSSR